MFNHVCLIAVVAGLSAAPARAADNPAGYLVSGLDGAPVVSGYGACVRTGQWTSEAGYRQCDPQPVALQEPAPTQAALVRIYVDMLFDFDSAALGANAGAVLDALVKELAQADYQAVNIVGRADRIGRAKHNQQLSEQRANAVRNYLAARGVDASKIAVSGVGSVESATAGQCKTLEGKELISCLQPDRSAEVTVIGKQTSAMR